MASSNTTLNYKHVFGINGTIADNITYIDEDTIAYIAGHCLVMYNRTEKRQKFIVGTDGSAGITAFTVSPQKKVVAIAERGEMEKDRSEKEKGQINIYDLRHFKKRKTLVNADSTSKDYLCMQFSEDNQYLLTLTGAPEYLLMCWNWSKAKLVASSGVSSGTPITRCSFSPTDPSMSCVTGKDAIKFFRITERDLRQVQDLHFEGHNFTCHVWLKQLPDHIVAATDKGDMLLLRAGEYLCHLSCAPGPECPIYSLTLLAKGLIAGSKNGKFFYIQAFTQADDANKFSLENSWAADFGTGNVVALACSPGEETLCAVTSDNQLLTMPLLAPNQLQPDLVKHMLCSFHGPKPVVGMDVCVRKPTIVTVSKDNSLRIWNYSTLELDVMKVFPEEMYCVALHPSGLHAAVGFADKLRVFHILVDELHPCLEISIKNCRECRFSGGGNFLAAANGNSVCVFDFYTNEKIADLRGHNGKVRGIFWLESGTQLLSCGQDGAVYLWDLEGCRRVGEFVLKGTTYTSTVTSDESVFVVGNDRMLRELELHDLTAVSKVVDSQVILSNLAIASSKSLLLAGTGEPGKPSAVRAYVYPVTGDYNEYPCMGTAITRLRVTPEEGYVAATDEFGCVFVFELKDRQERFTKQGQDSLVSQDWTDEVLVTRAELEDRNALITELTTKVEELKVHNEYQMKLKEMGYGEKAKEVTEKFMFEFEQAKEKYEVLKEERDDLETEFEVKLKSIEEKHQHVLQELETEFQAQIMEEVEKYQQLVRGRDAQLARLEDERRTLVATHERYVEALTSDFELKLKQDRQLREQMLEEKMEAQRELEEIHRQLEDDVDIEVENMRRAYEEKLTSCREATLKYKGENGIMRKKYTKSQKEIEDQLEEVRTLRDHEKELQDQIKVLDKEVLAHKKEIKVRDASIAEKEKRIYELKKKNQELDKFKFVLDYKIRELKRQIEPRQMEIFAMKDQIKNMDAELEKYHRANAELDNSIGALRETINETQEEAVTRRMSAKKLEHTVAQTKSGMHHAVTFIQDPVKLREAIEHLVKVHGSLSVPKPQVDPEVDSEYSRHKDYLARSIQQLQKSLVTDVSKHQSSNRVLMDDNLSLISEINAQRDANRMLKLRLQADIGRLQHIARAALNKSTTSSSVGDPFMEEQLDPNRKAETDSALQDPVIVLESNREYIKALRKKVAELNGRLVQQRAYSQEVLPPMDGVRDAYEDNRENARGGYRGGDDDDDDDDDL